MINELAKTIHQRNKDKGFFDEPKNIGEMLCLIHSEVSEALEADRKNNYCDRTSLALSNMRGEDNKLFIEMYNKLVKGTFEEEIADILIRVLDLAEFKGVDIEAHLYTKMKYNLLRPHKHGKKY